MIGGAGGGLAGMMLHRAASQAGQYMGAWYGQEATLAGGEVSGSPFDAARAVIQARTARGLAAHGAVAGGFSAIGSGASMMGGMVMGAGAMSAGAGAGLVGTAAAALSNPLGWGLLAGGALLEIATQWGKAAADAELQVLSAKQQSAVARYESVTGKRTALAEALVGQIPFGGTLTAEQAGAAGGRYGYTSHDVARRYAQYGRAGGRGLPAEVLLQMERGFGVGAETVGRFERAFLPGGGANRGGLDTQTHLETAIENGMKAGIDASRMPEYLNRISDYQQAFAERGLTINAGALQQFMSDFTASTGLRGMAGMKAAEGIRGFGEGVLSDLTNMLAPPEMLKGMALAQAMSKGGGIRGAARLLQSEEGRFDIAATINRQMPDFIQPFAMSQITGLAPEAAAKMRGWRPGMTVPTVGAGGTVLPAEAFRRSEEAGALVGKATLDNMETLAKSAGEVAAIFGEFAKMMQVSLANMNKLAPGALVEKSRAMDPNRFARENYSIPSWKQGVD